MRIPSTELQCDETYARLDQSSRQQAARAKRIFAKRLCESRRFLADVKRIARGLGSDDGMSLFAEAIETFQQLTVRFHRTKRRVQIAQQPLPLLDLSHRQTTLQRNSANAECLANSRRGTGIQWSILDAEKTGPLLRVVRNRYERRQVGRILQLRLFHHDRTIAWILQRRQGPTASVDVFLAESMSAQRVADASQDDELVHAAGKLRQVLADLNSGYVRVDRIELAAKFTRRVRLEIERVHVRWAAGQVYENGGHAARLLGNLTGFG